MGMDATGIVFFGTVVECELKDVFKVISTYRLETDKYDFDHVTRFENKLAEFGCGFRSMGLENHKWGIAVYLNDSYITAEPQECLSVFSMHDAGSPENRQNLQKALDLFELGAKSEPEWYLTSDYS